MQGKPNIVKLPKPNNPSEKRDLGIPVNVLVMGTGGYKFRDYFKVGAPMTVLLFVVVLVFLPLFWPLS